MTSIQFLEYPYNRFDYVSLNNGFTYKLLQNVSEGDYIAYIDWIDSNHESMTTSEFEREGGVLREVYSGNPNRSIISSIFPIYVDKIWIKKAGTKELIRLTKFNFRKRAKELFSNCPGILKKIKSGKFRKNNILEILHYHYDYCYENEEYFDD